MTSKNDRNALPRALEVPVDPHPGSKGCGCGMKWRTFGEQMMSRNDGVVFKGETTKPDFLGSKSPDMDHFTTSKWRNWSPSPSQKTPPPASWLAWFTFFPAEFRAGRPVGRAGGRAGGSPGRPVRVVHLPAQRSVSRSGPAG